jgi:phosphohistidine phosphatase
MKLLLVRHAHAVDLGFDGVSRDFDRYLSPKGLRQATALAGALKARGVVPSSVVTSPLVRAKQTAEPIAALLATNVHLMVDCEYLSTEGFRPKKLSKFVEDLGGDLVVLVGHQPDLGAYFGSLLSPEQCPIPMAKGGAALIDCPNGIGPGEGELLWYVTPEWYL